MAISEFTTPPANTNTWTSVETDAVGGSTKYGIHVTNASNPRYTFLNSSFYPAAKAGSIAIVELYANAEGRGAGDPNTVNYIYDGVALTNVAGSSIPAVSLNSSSNTAIYGVGSDTKVANYVYNFTNKGYADTKKMAIGGNKNRRVFAIRSWGEQNANYNKPYIAFIGDSSALNYDGSSAGFSVGCAGATRTTSANTWVSHTAGDGTKYYSITNTANNVNKYVSISLTAGHTYRFTLHAHTQATYDGVAICKTTNTLLLSSLTASDLISGSTSTGKCSGKDETTTFDYTVGASAETRYIYFKSNNSTIGASDGKSFADVMVEDLGDLRATQTAPTAANVTVEYEETATASASGGGHGTLQYRTQNPTTLAWNPWTTTAPTRTAIGTIKYQAIYTGNASYKPSAVSNTATLTVTPKKITKPTAVTGLVYNGNSQTGVNAPRYASTPSSPSSLIVEVSGTTSGKNTGSYSATYTIKNNNYCWVDMTTASITVNWSIAQREVTLSWGTTSWTYDGNSHSTTCTVGNLVGSDSCFINLSGNNITNAGSTTVTATALSNSNYKLPSNKSTTLTVTAKEATLSWGTTSWTYDGNSHSTTCTVSNLVGSDSCTVNLSNNSITDIGSIRVTAASLSNSNYKLPSSKSTTLTIKPCMHVKADGTWVPVIQAYKKENGVWVRQTTTIGSLFSTSGRYLGRYQDLNTGEWKNLIDG